MTPSGLTGFRAVIDVVRGVSPTCGTARYGAPIKGDVHLRRINIREMDYRACEKGSFGGIFGIISLAISSAKRERCIKTTCSRTGFLIRPRSQTRW